MRDFGGDITAELAAEIKKIFTVIEFQLESGTEYYTDCDIGLYIPHEDAHPDYLSELKLHLKMNEGFGDVALDSSGNDRDGAITGSPAWSPGIVGSSIEFDGNNDKVTVDHHTDFDLVKANGAFTISCWINATALASRNGIIAKRVGGDTQYWQMVAHGSKIEFYMNDDGTTVDLDTTDNQSTGEWIHVVFVMNAGWTVGKFYINGVADNSANFSSITSCANSTDLLIGREEGNSDTWDGLIDNLQFYKGQALTQAEVNEVYKREYTATDYRLKNMTHTLGMAVDSVTLTFPSAALGWGAQVGNYDIRGTAVIMSNVFLDDNNQIVVGPREMFRGFIDDWNLKQPDIDITFANSFIHWNKKVLRRPGPSCAWPFKSTECAYAGGETWCNQSYVRCVQLANTDNFGGSRYLPSLVAKKIWWGRTPVFNPTIE